MKQPKEVVDALAAVEHRTRELAEAKAVVDRLEGELRTAFAAVRQAKERADSGLPQCDRVSVGWRSGKVEPAGRVVIVRATPGGVLVVRMFGTDSESRFKRSPTGVFLEAARRDTWASNRLELRNVPEEFAAAGVKKG